MAEAHRLEMRGRGKMRTSRSLLKRVQRTIDADMYKIRASELVGLRVDRLRNELDENRECPCSEMRKIAARAIVAAPHSAGSLDALVCPHDHLQLQRQLHGRLSSGASGSAYGGATGS